MLKFFPLILDAFRFTPAGIKRTLKFWLETETHVFAFAIAANVLLSFYPFLLVMASLCKTVLQSPKAVDAIGLAVRDFFAGEAGNFLVYNLGVGINGSHRRFEWASVLLLLFTANGVFLPLEVALNRAWGVTKNRSFWRNQVVSTALIFGCGALVLLASIISAANATLFTSLLGRWPWAVQGLMIAMVRLLSLPVSVLALLLVYWLLPNKKVKPLFLIPGAIRVALALELCKWLSLWITPFMLQKFERETVVFQHSLTIITWSFFAAMIVLAGAQSSAARALALEQRELEEARRTALPATLAVEPPTKG